MSGRNPGQGYKSNGMKSIHVRTLCFLGMMTGILACQAQNAESADSEGDAVRFIRKQLYTKYIAEGAAIGDVDGDGQADIVSGPLWWKGPSFDTPKAYDTLVAYPYQDPGTSGYARIFFTFPHDFDGDMRMDVLQVGLPGENSLFFSDLAGHSGYTPAKPAIPKVANESPLVADMLGDTRPELVAFSEGRLIIGRAGKEHGAWEALALSETDPDRFATYTHGLGIGDINMDGRPDIIENRGWWEYPADWDKKSKWTFHPNLLSEGMGGSQILVFDVNGDGKNDVVTALNAHEYGLSWFEQNSAGRSGEIRFTPHEILPDTAGTVGEIQNFSQLHAMAQADIDGDGITDFVTGKCFFAHNGHDPGASDPAVLYWFRTVRKADGTVTIEPNLIDSDSGVGRQISIGDVNGDGKPDIVTSNKKGVFLFVQV